MTTNELKRTLAVIIMAVALFASYAVPTFADSTVTPKAGDVTINNANFPDSVFRDYVKGFDTDGNDVLSEAEIAAVDKIQCSNKGIENLKGIEHFTSITRLDCGMNELQSLDISKNTLLTNLHCDINKITSLDVSKNTRLTQIFCAANPIESLDVSKNLSLAVLNCISCNISSIDVSKNLQLSTLLISGCNKITSLDVSNNKQLETLWTANTSLSSLDVSKNLALESLMCDGNKLTTIDVSNNTNLELLNCSSNLLTDLDVSKNTKIKDLVCSDNSISELELTDNTALETLRCDNNKLKSLDVSKNTNLLTLACSGNHLTNLDTESNINLGVNSLDNQTSNGEFYKSGSKYVVDLTQFEGVDPDKVTVTDGGVKNGSKVTYDTLPASITYTYATDTKGTEMANVVVTLTEGTEPKVDDNKDPEKDNDKTIGSDVKGSNGPATGDDSIMMVWLLLAGIAGAGTVFAVKKRASK